VIAFLVAALIAKPTDAVLSRRDYRFDGFRWQVVNVRHDQGQGGYGTVIFKNGKRITSWNGGGDYDSVFLDWPFGSKLLAMSQHSGAGHGMDTIFYVCRRGVLKRLSLGIDGEPGGPVYRDLDRDGRPEMIFDNWDHYKAMDGPSPTALEVYKVASDLTISHWKTLPNPKHKRLPNRLPFIEGGV